MAEFPGFQTIQNLFKPRWNRFMLP